MPGCMRPEWIIAAAGLLPLAILKFLSPSGTHPQSHAVHAIRVERPFLLLPIYPFVGTKTKQKKAKQNRYTKETLRPQKAKRFWPFF